MPLILLTDWARRNHVSPDNAKSWAKRKLIPAQLAIVKTKRYVIDSSTPLPKHKLKTHDTP